MFYCSLPIIALAFIINSFILFMFTFQWLVIYAILFIFLIILSALPAKNFGREFYAIELWFSALFLIVSVIAEAFTFVIWVKGLINFFGYFLLWSISNVAVVISILHVTVSSQRISLRGSAGLVDNFFTKQKEIWKNELQEFPNIDKIIQCLNEGKFVLSLFDKGFFNLTVLWSCNIMEKIIDAATDEIITRNPEKRNLFRTDDGKRRNYPYQLKILEFEYSTVEKSFDVDKLWNKLRNRIAHHNYKPTFDETYETLKILVSFTKEMPKNLKSWLT